MRNGFSSVRTLPPGGHSGEERSRVPCKACKAGFKKPARIAI